VNLNNEQKKAVYAKDRFLFLLAGAGSGKTRVLTKRVKVLIENKVPPNQILAITFTKKAANEMKERIQNEAVHVFTFHALCYQKLVEMKLNFRLVDEVNLPFHPDDLLKITKYKNSLYRTTKPYMYDQYQTYLKNNQLLDYDDLLYLIYEKLKRKTTSFSYQYIFVDEFQDTNPLQYACLKLMIKKDTQVFCVGDPDQSIYQFRGATKEIIQLYIKDFFASLYQLNDNYRSSPHIVYLSNRLIERNQRTFKKKLNPTKETNGLTYSIFYKNEIDESNQVVDLIKYIKKNNKKDHSIAVLYRHHHRVFDLEMKLHDAYISFQIDDSYEERNPDLYLLTIHQAKGLEFDTVIILGLENQTLPSYQISTSIELEEERRLMFVAMTRAKENLIFTHVKYYHKTHCFTPSLFILESGIKKISPKQLNDIISLGDYDGYKTKND
jgi:DNA helicase II / ATP-dependent DNA helicase PcrA